MKLRTLFFLLSLEAAAGAAPTSLRHDPPKTTHRLSAVELDRTAREAMTLAPPKLPKHATLSAVRCSTSPEVPVSPKLVTLDVSPVPRRAGAVPVTAVLAFYKDDDAPIRVPRICPVPPIQSFVRTTSERSTFQSSTDGNLRTRTLSERRA